ncbi:MAG TPA: DUF255 domain-containing protein, partial [Candidatus Kapabacteria bacterium]|nr:DUF255 domain-containing protein [Candidatus Kapabacteria bacterium]
ITVTLVLIIAAVAFRVGASSNGGASHPTKIEWKNLTDGMKLSHTTNKKILMDVYTDWCTWCKTMDKETYGEDTIIAYISDHFIPVRLNAESKDVRQIDTLQMTDAELADAFNVTAYPTTIFIQSDGRPITSIPGYIKTDEFKNVLRYIAEDAYLKMGYEDYKKTVK